MKARGRKMHRSLSISLRRFAVVLSVLGVLSSLWATAHVHASDGDSPASCSLCVQAAHRTVVTAGGIDLAVARIEASLPPCERAALRAATLFRARGRAPPVLASLPSR